VGNFVFLNVGLFVMGLSEGVFVFLNVGDKVGNRVVGELEIFIVGLIVSFTVGLAVAVGNTVGLLVEIEIEGMEVSIEG
jgi:hypothetical protein